MSRIARTISTIALVVATAGLIAPAAQARADGLDPHVAPKLTVNSGIDWTFPVMGAVALALVMMILGEQVLARRGRPVT